MKKLFTIILAFSFATGIFSQTPKKMSYQAVVRGVTNELIIDQEVGMQISILQGSASGTAVYVETQTPTTNGNGLVSIEIGAGTVEIGDFATIDWANGPYFIKTETDPDGGSTYSITGTSQLLSVPYALHSGTSDVLTGEITESQISDLQAYYPASNPDGFISDYTVTEEDITSHQGALEITESQITDLDHFTTADETDPSVPTGTQNGEMQYWDGSEWVVVEVTENEGAILQMIDGVPTWVGGTPSLTTTAVTSVTGETAESGGDISDDVGATVTERGVCWSTNHNPTRADNKTFDGTGTGSFSSSITGLLSNTTYYVRAYATNRAGTAYGNQHSFTTEAVVTNPATGKTWMGHNLGASSPATSSTDEEAYGHLYQWGRAADGHESRTSITTSTLSTTDTPGHGDFIIAPDDPYDWRSTQNDNLWQGVSGTNNPCPSGYRLPTEAEWDAERQSWSSDDADGAYDSPLKLPLAGIRATSGSLGYVGSGGLYWSSTIAGTQSRHLAFGDFGTYMDSTGRVVGQSVRCIKD